MSTWRNLTCPISSKPTHFYVRSHDESLGRPGDEAKLYAILAVQYCLKRVGSMTLGWQEVMYMYVSIWHTKFFHAYALLRTKLQQKAWVGLEKVLYNKVVLQITQQWTLLFDIVT